MQDDSFDVRLRDGRGTMLSSVSKHELSIAEPKKKDSVKIMKGTYAGSTGRVKVFTFERISLIASCLCRQ